MGRLTRFGVSLDEGLLARLDDFCRRRHYASRSEALRDMIRETLDDDALRDDDAWAAGVLTMVYDHHQPDLSRRLTERQHEAGDIIVSSMHVHLDHHHCLETLVLRGRAALLRNLADELRAIKGVGLGSLSLTAVLPDPGRHDGGHRP